VAKLDFVFYGSDISSKNGIQNTKYHSGTIQMPACCALIIGGGENLGTVCGNNIRGDAVRCGKHDPSFVRAPVAAAQRELGAYAKGLLRRAELAFAERVIDVNYYIILSRRVRVWLTARRRHVALNEEVIHTLSFPYGDPVPEQFTGVYNGRIIPFPANAVPPARRRAPPPQPVRQGVPPPQQPVRRARRQQAPPANPLAEFAADRQNVHTALSVRIATDVVTRVLRIPVPKEYRWNMNTVSKTVGEIITECNLTADEMVEMLNRYIRDDDVYEMGKGIYGKVLDGVWQYIRESPDKADMCRVLKQELRDNIGMCAQGNLTRLCNVLSGYMDGIGPQESVSERLGRELPLMLEIDDVSQRMTRAKALLREVALPETEWVPWLEALA
jgi:hypothetical protein